MAEARRGPARWLGPCAAAALALLLQTRAEAPAAWWGACDGAKYLTLARNAPRHRLYDGHTYVIHPPLHGWSIALVGQLGPSLEQAGVLLGAAASAGLAAVTWGLARGLLGASAPAALGGVLLLAGARGTLTLGQGVWREPLQTLLVYGLLLLTLRPGDSPRRRVAAAALGGAMGLTWDPFALLLPLLLLGSWRLRRPALLAAAAGLLLTWGTWAGLRYHWLRAAPSYPAGIDGLWEDTSGAGWQAAFNPNFLPGTARHNDYFWPRQATPLRALQAAAPWWTSAEAPTLTERTPGPGLRLASELLLVVAGVGGALALARAGPRRGALLLAVAAGGLLGAPALLGQQERYGFTLLPLLALALAAGLEAAAPAGRRDRRRALRALVALAWIGTTLAAAGTRPVWAWTRPRYYEAYGVAAALAGPVRNPGALAAPVGLTPDLTWQLPDRRVATLPFGPEGLPELLERREVRLLVLPHEAAVWERPGASPARIEEAHGLPALRWVHGEARAGRLRYLGTTLEAERTDALRVRGYDLFWRGPDGPAPFEVLVAPGSWGALGEALEAGAASAETVRLLRVARARLVPAGAAPTPDQARVLSALDPE